MLLASLASPLAAADVPVNDQEELTQRHPALALAPGGELMVAWQSEAVPPNGMESIEARFYRADGSAVGPQLRVSDLNLPGVRPAAVSLGGGQFLVAWQSGGRFIRARRYDTSGAPIGTFFNASEDGWPNVGEACVRAAAGADGRFALAWIGFNAYVEIQRFAADGSPAGSRIVEAPVADEEHFCPSIAYEQDGSFAVAWIGVELASGPLYSMWLQRHAADGASVGPRTRVDDGSLTNYGYPALVSQPDGTLLVAWVGEKPSTGVEKPVAQRYSPAGSPLGGNFELYSRGFDLQAARDAEGYTVVVIDTAGELEGIVARRLAPDGTFLGGMVQVSSVFAQQITPAVSVNPGGDFVAAWTAVNADGNDPTGQDIVRSEVQSIVRVFADGFETGDTTRWTTIH